MYTGDISGVIAGGGILSAGASTCNSEESRMTGIRRFLLLRISHAYSKIS